ncbi:hypothetical protein BC828DRAFT_377400 [Blastocladiella britannica]|nr:hypothetical protein BC828DRAFT_377400 [Blastocladiella britannica]
MLAASSPVRQRGSTPQPPPLTPEPGLARTSPPPFDFDAYQHAIPNLSDDDEAEIVDPPLETTEEPVPMPTLSDGIARPLPNPTPSQLALRSRLEEATTCLICEEQWTNNGPHHVVSLACGHLFGRSCITRWLCSVAREKKKCPNCNALAKQRDLRRIYPPTVMTIDPARLDELREEVAAERRLREQAEQSNRQLTMALNVTRAELRDAERKVRELEMERKRFFLLIIVQSNHSHLCIDNNSWSMREPLARVDSLGSSGSELIPPLPPPILPPIARNVPFRDPHAWRQDHALALPGGGTFRHLAPLSPEILAFSWAQPAGTHSILLYSLAASATSQPSQPLHAKPIRHVSVSPPLLGVSQHPHLLTASADGSACLVNGSSLVAATRFYSRRQGTYFTASSFDPAHAYRVWLGTSTGTVAAFDVRWPAAPCTELVPPPIGVPTPLDPAPRPTPGNRRRGMFIHSLLHTCAGPPGGTLLAASLSDVVSWEGLATDSPAATAATAAYPPLGHADTGEQSLGIPGASCADVAMDAVTAGSQCYALEEVWDPEFAAVTNGDDDGGDDDGSPATSVVLAWRHAASPVSATVARVVHGGQPSEPTMAAAMSRVVMEPPRVDTGHVSAFISRVAAWRSNGTSDTCIAIPNATTRTVDVYTKSMAAVSPTCAVLDPQLPSPIVDVKCLDSFLDSQRSSSSAAPRLALLNEHGAVQIWSRPQ